MVAQTFCTKCNDYAPCEHIANPNYARDIETIDRIIGEIHQSMERPGSKELTSSQMRARADDKRHMATQIKLTGGRVKPEYQ